MVLHFHAIFGGWHSRRPNGFISEKQTVLGTVSNSTGSHTFKPLHINSKSMRTESLYL